MDKIKNNLKTKVLSVIVAIILWSFVISTVNPPTSKKFQDVPVTLVNMESLTDRGLVIVSPKYTTIQLELTGKRNIMYGVKQSDIRASIDVKGYGEGTHTLPINLLTPQETRISESDDLHVEVVIEKKLQKQMPVTVTTAGQLEDNVIMEKMTPSPSDVFVEGPQSAVEKIDKIAAVVDVAGVESDATVNVTIQPLDREGNPVKGVTLGLSFVNVALSVSVSKEVPIEVVTTSASPEGVKVTKKTVSPQSVMVTGKKETLDKVTKISTKPVDLSQIDKNTTAEIEAVLPEGVVLLDPNKKIQYSIEVDKVIQKTLTIPWEDVEQVDLAAGKTVERIDEDAPLRVEISGYSKDIVDITPQSLKPRVNLSHVVLGQYSIKPEFTTGAGVQLLSVNPETLRIRVQ